MLTQAQIEQNLRDRFPLMFDVKDPVNQSQFLASYKRLLAYMKEIANPFLNSDTVRYQSLVLYSSLILVSIKLFNLDKIKIGDNEVAVNSKLYVVYSIFVAILLSLYLLRVWIDRYRAKLVRSDDSWVAVELNDLMSIGLLKIRIQHYFLLKTFDTIGQTYKEFAEVSSEVIHQKREPFEPVMLSISLAVDLPKWKTIPELREEIETQEEHLRQLTAELARDESAFIARANAILVDAKAAAEEEKENPLHAYARDFYSEMTAAFDAHLRQWFDARSTLSSEHLSHSFERLGDDSTTQRINVIHSLLKREKSRRMWYALVEVWIPVFWALGAIFFVTNS